MRVTAFLVVALLCLATFCVAGKSDDVALRLTTKSVAEVRSSGAALVGGERRSGDDDHDDHDHHEGDGHDHSSGSNPMGINLHIASVFMAGVVTLVGNTAPRSY